MNPKVFTLQEANSELPSIADEIQTIKTIQKDFLEVYHQRNTLRSRLNHVEHSVASYEDIFLYECQLEFMNMLAKNHIYNIRRKGALLVDIQSGAIDFPALLNDQFVYFSWQRGEDEVLYYHNASEGYQQRKPIL